MPKLKPNEIDIDVKELEEAEYTEGSYESYDGEIPPTGTMVRARITKMWLTATSNGDTMLKVLAVAEDNADGLEEYDGLPIWENLALVPGAKFRWQPFLDCFGFTLRDIKNKMYVEDDDNIGAPIEKIGAFVPGSDEALCDLVIKRDRYNGDWQAKASEWLEPEEEDEEPEPKPAPKRRATAKPAANRGKRRAEPEPEDEDDEEPEEKPARRAPRGRKPAAKAKPATRRRARAEVEDDDEDEPPF